ncbi:MAG: 4-(cytidine 5'-diphospho)-2-C-methyl-D-erythritol kinase [Oceanobacter sp.]
MTDRNTLTLPSPAKLNLMLHITGRRPDGYHTLQTLFQFLDYGDTLSYRLRTDDQLTLTPQVEGVGQEENLIIKAARKLQTIAAERCLPVPGADITLKKILPMGGGLGGGSSNAATTLLALNQLWNLELSLEQLADIGLSLGADVPVFVKGQAAFAEGVGEILTPTPELPEKWFLIACPNVHINTGEVFSNKSLTRDTDPISIRTALREEGNNDCQTVVSMNYPEIGNTLNLLNKFSSAKLTGTGACVFSSFDSSSEAIRVSEQLPADVRYFIAKGVNVSPTHKVLFKPS